MMHPPIVILVAASLLCFNIVATTPVDLNITETATNRTAENYNCPEDCKCVVARNTHKPLLHAKCSSLNGLKSENPAQSTLPIHSIDLSYLGLTRLAHSLKKLPELTSIDLSHNDLHEIGHLGRRIKKLNLKHNRITSGKLGKLPLHLQVLNLQHNDITSLPLEFTKLEHLQSLELSHNRINCSCETLEVRNWLQDQHVFMEHPVTCTYPAEARGKSWLQIKQVDMCKKEDGGWFESQDENELMMGDQPIEDSNDNDEDEEEDELGKAFLPIDTNTPKSSELKLADVEGSGDLSVMNLPLHVADDSILASTIAPNIDENDDEGSGSGGGLLVIPHLIFDTNQDEDEIKEIVEETTLSPAVFGVGMGIFDNDNAKTDGPVNEEMIVPVEHHDLGADNDLTDKDNDENDELDDIVQRANVGTKDDSNATYFLLSVIVLIVIGLILFVAIKRCTQKSSNNRDVENARTTELLDMDKQNLGKPINRNGLEHSPLIGEKTKADLAKPINGTNKKAYDANDVKDGPGQQQPLLNGNGTTNGHTNANNLPTINEPVNEQTPHEYYPITSRYPPPKSPRASKYAQGEYNNNNPDDSYLPSSPKSGRYSPVYSPETGRVKIKMTETPRPKTPMLVTRSKSNAGDIISTPVHGGVVNVANGH